MAAFSALQLRSFTWNFLTRPPTLFFCGNNCASSLFYNSRTRWLGCLSTSTTLTSIGMDQTEASMSKKDSTLRELCQGHVPDQVLHRLEDVGYIEPTPVQNEALPVLFSGRDCVIQAQTGSGKTLAYLLLIFSAVNAHRSAVQALVVVPTRELGMQVARVTRKLAVKSSGLESEQKSCTVMALLDGGTLKRHKSWLKVEPPSIVIATLQSLCQMLDRKILKLDSMRVLVIDELLELNISNDAMHIGSQWKRTLCLISKVDGMFNSSKEVSLLKKLLTVHTSISNRQTIFASASIPQHRRFLYDSIQQKWTKADVVHVHVNPVQRMPSCIYHRFVICSKTERCSTLLELLKSDSPKSAIIFVGEQSEKSKKAGNVPPTALIFEFLESSYGEGLELVLLEEDMNFNQRAATLTDVKQSGGYLLVATDIAARGVDLPETTHIYNFDLPKDAVNYLHRAGRTGRKPFSDSKCFVTSILTSEERFVLQRFENELLFHCEELFF